MATSWEHWESWEDVRDWLVNNGFSELGLAMENASALTNSAEWAEGVLADICDTLSTATTEEEARRWAPELTARYCNGDSKFNPTKVMSLLKA